MSSYNLSVRGVIAATSADGVGPKDYTLAGAVKPASCHLGGTVREVRGGAVVAQAGVVHLTEYDAPPYSIPLASPVDIDRAVVTLTHKDDRGVDPTKRGVVAAIDYDGEGIELDYAPLEAGETLDVNYQVTEHPEASAGHGAILTLYSATKVRLSWDGAILPGESITASFELIDFESLGDDIKEALFRLENLLGLLGANYVEDLITRDDAGNKVSFRIRVFDSKAHAEDATLDLPAGDGLEAGEQRRITISQEIDTPTNDRISSLGVETDVLATPGVD
jgi:hypothetical protein